MDIMKEKLIEIIKNFARTAGGPLSGRFFEMMSHDVAKCCEKVVNLRCES
jgi:hypothetical protein